MSEIAVEEEAKLILLGKLNIDFIEIVAVIDVIGVGLAVELDRD